MTIDMFRKILDHTKAPIRRIQMYVYSDPLVHPQADLFYKECFDRRIPSQVSTMLQPLNCDLEKLVEARPTELRISFSGFKHLSEHQKGGTLERFMKNLDRISPLPRYPETEWGMFFHVYKDTVLETSMAKKLAEQHRLRFTALPAIFMPCEKVVEGNYSDLDKQTIAGLLETPDSAIARMKHDHGYCPLQTKQVTIDAKGQVYLCQLVYEDRFILGNYLDMDLETIQAKIQNHSFCGKCLAKGAHTYQQCYVSPLDTQKDIVEGANKKRGYPYPSTHNLERQ
jgi:radical SAM protein with 4Fe4S-binding SPASM domain